jgi:hypothetical protein
MNRIILACSVALLSATATILAQNIGKPTPEPPATHPIASATAGLSATKPGETVITFENADVGHPVPSITEKGVTFALAAPLQQSAAVPRVMFFPHLKTNRDGILNAMSNEQGIPVKITFPAPVSSVTLVMWGATDTHVLVEAHGKDDKLLDSASLAKTPDRKDPGDPVPSFELTVKGEHIAYVLFGGAGNGNFIAVEELRYVPAPAGEAPATTQAGK